MIASTLRYLPKVYQIRPFAIELVEYDAVWQGVFCYARIGPRSKENFGVWCVNFNLEPTDNRRDANEALQEIQRPFIVNDKSFVNDLYNFEVEIPGVLQKLYMLFLRSE
jgi:hypothetical protein